MQDCHGNLLDISIQLRDTFVMLLFNFGHILFLCSYSSEKTSKQPGIFVSCLQSLVLCDRSHFVYTFHDLHENLPTCFCTQAVCRKTRHFVRLVHVCAECCVLSVVLLTVEGCHCMVVNAVRG